MDAHHSGSTSLRPTPSRRKSSNILASLGRQGTLNSDKNAKDGRSNSIVSSSTNGPVSAIPLSAASTGRESVYVPSSSGASYTASTSTSSSSSYLLNENNLHPPPIPTPSAPTAQNTPSSSSSFGVALDNLRYLLQKRSSTFGYLKRAHEGKVHWFNTILLQREELDAVFENQKMAKRTARFAVLGMSLSVLLEISTAHDFLRGLLSLLQEYDTIDDENLKAKTKNLFKPGKAKRPSGTGDYPLSVQESGDLSYFFSPNIPFDLDYFQVLCTLCDILSEVYLKILSFLGPSPSSLAASSPNPAFPGFPQPATASSSSFSSFQTGPGGNTFAGVDRRSAGLSPMLVEVVLKIDGKLKKIIFQVTKELDAVARNAIKDELAFIGDSLSGLATGDGAF